MPTSAIPIRVVAAGGLPDRVQERLRESNAHAESNVQAVTARLEAKTPLLETLAALCQQRNITCTARVRRMWRLADAWSEAIAPAAACTRGCNHCCHVAVAVFESEAKSIAQELKVELARHPADHNGVHPTKEEFAQDFGYHRPCVFLRDGECSIYENRPLACRLQLNMDIDSLLCELHPGHVIEVPYANASSLHMLAAAMFFKDDVADIREWFSGRSSSRKVFRE